MNQSPSPREQFTLEFDALGRLVLVGDGGQRTVDVSPVRAFPVSDPEHWIAICDAEGHEIVSIEDPASLPAGVRQVLDEALARREFVPVIERIHSVTHAEPSAWTVETDRGPTTFQLNSDDDVRRIEQNQALVIDSHGIRYVIPDLRSLDGGSRRLLEHFL